MAPPAAPAVQDRAMANALTELINILEAR